MAEPPGNRASGFRPALIGGLHRVTAAGHLPDRLPPLSIPRIPIAPASTLLCSPKQTGIAFLSLAWIVTRQHATLTLLQVQSSLTEYYRWIYGYKWDGVMSRIMFHVFSVPLGNFV